MKWVVAYVTLNTWLICSGGSESELMPGQKHKGGLGVLPQENFYNWSSKTYSFGNFWEEIVIE